MQVEHINPFLLSTIHLFETMLGTTPDVGETALITQFNSHRWDVSGVIGVTGKAEGVVAIRMTFGLVEQLLKKSGIEYNKEEEYNAVISSMVGEMANVIAGNALADITKYDLDITVPIVVQGKNHSVSWPEKSPIISVPFRSSQGAFEINVSLRDV